MDMTTLKQTCGTIEISKNIFPNVVNTMISLPEMKHLNLNNTVLDPRVLELGGYINLPIEINNIFDKPVRKIVIPSMKQSAPISGHIVLNDIQTAVEKLLIIIDLYHEEIEDKRYLIYAARAIWETMADELCNKSGLINKYVLGFRAQFSTKGHIATSYRFKHNEIGLPAHIYKKFNEEWNRRNTVNSEEPAYAMVFRNPLLHNDSMRKLYIKATESDRIVINPIITEGMGADSDGDLIEIVLGYPDVKIEEDWSTAKWDKEFLADNTNPEPDFHNIINDAKERIHKFRVIGPHDLIDPTVSQTVLELKNAEDLNMEDIKGFFHGKSKEEIVEDDNNVVTGLILQKSEIGRSGSAACRARVLANDSIDIAKAANIMSEQASQRLFDSKHKLDDTYRKLIQVLKRPTLKFNYEQAVAMLEDCNIDLDKVKPYLKVLYCNDEKYEDCNITAKEGCVLSQIVDKRNPMFAVVFDGMAPLYNNNKRKESSFLKIKKFMLQEDENDLIRYLRSRIIDIGVNEND